MRVHSIITSIVLPIVFNQIESLLRLVLLNSMEMNIWSLLLTWLPSQMFRETTLHMRTMERYLTPSTMCLPNLEVDMQIWLESTLWLLRCSSMLWALSSWRLLNSVVSRRLGFSWNLLLIDLERNSRVTSTKRELPRLKKTRNPLRNRREDLTKCSNKQQKKEDNLRKFKRKQNPHRKDDGQSERNQSQFLNLKMWHSLQ